jgi:hypothetical protein
LLSVDKRLAARGDYLDAAAAADEAAASALEAAAMADEAAESAAEAATIGAGAATGAGAGASSFLPQAARAKAATRVARTSDLFMFILKEL